MRWSSRKSQSISRLLFGAGLVYLGFLLRQLGHSVDWRLLVRYPSLAGVILCLFVMASLVQFFCWWFITNRKSGEVSLSRGYFAYGAAAACHYVPAGKALQFVNMHQATERDDQRINSAYSLFVLIVINYMGGFLAALPGITMLTTSFIPFCVGALFVILGLYCFRRGWLLQMAKWVGLYKGPSQNDSISFPLLLIALITQIVFGWVIECACCLASLGMLGVAVPWKELFFVLSCHFIATLGGAASLIVPAGIGIREGIFLSLLRAHFASTQAIWIVLVLRLGSVASELIFLVPLFVQMGLGRLGVRAKGVSHLPQNLHPELSKMRDSA